MAIGTCYKDDALPRYDDLEERSLTGVTLSDIVRLDFTNKKEETGVQQNLPCVVSLFRNHQHIS
jgi:hypothetical protein